MKRLICVFILLLGWNLPGQTILEAPGLASFVQSSAVAPGWSFPAGTILWVKDLTNGTSDGAAVASWPDLSGNGNTPIAAGSARPTFKTNILNGLPIMRFDGAANSMSVAAFAGGTIAQPNTIIGVFRMPTAAGFVIDGVAAGRNIIQLDSGTSAARLYAGSFADAGAGTAVTTWQLMSAVYNNSGTSRIRLNRREYTVNGTIGVQGMAGVTLGGTYDGNLGQSDQAEWLIVPGVISDADLGATEKYLSNKWLNTNAVYSTHTSDVLTNNNPFDYWVPTNAPAHGQLVYFFHGAGGDPTDIMASRWSDTLQSMLTNGWTVIGAYAGGDKWGNSNSVAIHSSVLQWATNNFQPTNIVLLAESMGGLAEMSVLSQWPNITKAYGVSTVCDLSNFYFTQITYSNSVKSAYGLASDNSDFMAKTTNYFPMAMPTSLFAGKTIKLAASPSDGTVDKIKNADALVTRLNGIAASITETNTTDIHGGPLNYLPLDIVGFLK